MLLPTIGRPCRQERSRVAGNGSNLALPMLQALDHNSAQTQPHARTLRTRICTHTHKHTRAHTHTHTFTRSHTHTHVCTHTQTPLHLGQRLAVGARARVARHQRSRVLAHARRELAGLWGGRWAGPGSSVGGPQELHAQGAAPARARNQALHPPNVPHTLQMVSARATDPLLPDQHCSGLCSLLSTAQGAIPPHCTPRSTGAPGL